MKKFFAVLFALQLSWIVFAVAAAQERFTPFPDASSSYWRSKVPRTMRADYIRLGRENVAQPWKRIPDSVFAEFRTTGNRTNYEDKCFAVRRRLSCLVMAEIMEHRGRFMPSIRDGLHYFLCDEPWWGLPAHYPKAQPDTTLQVVDLFNAETSSMLAWTVYMLGDEINRTETGLAERVRGEIVRRFIRPTLHERQGWMQNANNWNTWITSNFLECSLLCLDGGTRERGAALRTVESCLRLFLEGYPDDGGCEEGVGYWDRAGASFFESLWMLHAAEPSFLPTDHRYILTTAEQKKVAAMGRFITTMHISDLAFVNFSDAQVHNVPNINILFPYGVWIGDNGMKEFAAYIARKYDYFSKPSTLFLQSGNWPTLGRELMLLSMLPQLREAKAEQPSTRDAWLANSQVMVARNADWLVAAKGGTNGESHNHNDIGNFIVYHNSWPVVIDLGRDTYTSQTFSKRRYELMNNRSMYHNVPLVNGVEQHDGSRYKASGASHLTTDTASIFTLDIAKAYPEEAGVESWKRTVGLNHKSDRVEVVELFRMATSAGVKDSVDVAANHKPTEITLMCYGKPMMRQPSCISLADGNVSLVYDAAKLDASWTKVEMNDGIMKTQWKDNVYRLVLRLKHGSDNGTVSYRFEPCR